MTSIIFILRSGLHATGLNQVYLLSAVGNHEKHITILLLGYTCTSMWGRSEIGFDVGADGWDLNNV